MISRGVSLSQGVTFHVIRYARYMRVLALLFAVALHADERTQQLADRLAREADAFERNAPQVVGRETFHQRTLVPAPRSKIRVGKAADEAPGTIWQEREIVSQYGFTRLGQAIHELRQVTFVDGRQVDGERRAQEELAKLISAGADERKRRSLQQFEKYGLRGGVTDFGQILLLFSRASIERYEITYLGPRMLSPARIQAFHYKQLDGPQALAVYRQDRRGKVRHLSVEGEIWVRDSDGLPLRVTLNATDSSSDQVLREEAVVDYAASEFGTVLPFQTVHRELRAGVLVTENRFTYGAFHKFGAPR